MMAVSFLLVFFVKIPVDSFLLSMIKTRVDWGVRVKGVGVRKPSKKNIPLYCEGAAIHSSFRIPLKGPILPTRPSLPSEQRAFAYYNVESQTSN